MKLSEAKKILQERQKIIDRMERIGSEIDSLEDERDRLENQLSNTAEFEEAETTAEQYKAELSRIDEAANSGLFKNITKPQEQLTKAYSEMSTVPTGRIGGGAI